MNRIQQLSNERQQLWRKASHRELSDTEYWRLQQITRELTNLWDSYRRQHAGGAWNGHRRAADDGAPDAEPLERAA